MHWANLIRPDDTSAELAPPAAAVQPVVEVPVLYTYLYELGLDQTTSTHTERRGN